MTHIPRLFCSKCGEEMRNEETGLRAEVLTSDGKPYYKIALDLWECEQGCSSVLLPAPMPFSHHFHPDYNEQETSRSLSLK